jgi:soluble lytic murein transglycosylase-like protein
MLTALRISGTAKGVLCMCLALCGLLVSAPARAQIYTWHDANGHLVLSDRPGAGVERTFGVPQAVSVRTTRPVASSPSHDYDELIDEYSHQNDVRPDLVRAVVQVESAFNPYARSPKGAMGLMQLMPATADQFGVKNAFNPEENVRAGVSYLRQLLNRYDNDEQLALAAYNAGPGAVDRHGQSIPPYRETQNYVGRISSLAAAAPNTTTATRRDGTIYRTVDIVDGREVIKFSDTKPTGQYEVLGR